MGLVAGFAEEHTLDQRLVGSSSGFSIGVLGTSGVDKLVDTSMSGPTGLGL